MALESWTAYSICLHSLCALTQRMTWPADVQLAHSVALWRQLMPRRSARPSRPGVTLCFDLAVKPDNSAEILELMRFTVPARKSLTPRHLARVQVCFTSKTICRSRVGIQNSICYLTTEHIHHFVEPLYFSVNYHFSFGKISPNAQSNLLLVIHAPLLA